MPDASNGVQVTPSMCEVRRAGREKEGTGTMGRSTLAPTNQDYGYEDEQGEHSGTKLLREILEVAILTVLFFGIVRLLIQNYRVDGFSMMPTLHNNQYILVDKATYYTRSPERGDVIVFEWPKDTSQDFVKRVIGVPGDTVQTDADGTITVDGVKLNEPYVNDLINPDGPHTWKLGPNQYFVLGDNRGDSSDSREWGIVPRNDIIGRAALVYWPLPDIHVLPDWSGVFKSVS
jgi:signal peptidase I